MAKRNNITIAGPADENRLGANPSGNPTGSPTTNGEPVPGGYKRTPSPNAAPEISRDGSKGQTAKENVGGRS